MNGKITAITTSRLFKIIFWMGILLLVYQLFYYLTQAHNAWHYPDELNYAEGIVWEQAELMGTSLMYGSINHYPYVVFHYPPLYHVLVNFVHQLGFPMLQSGRMINQLAAIGLCFVIGLLVYRSSPGLDETTKGRGALAAGLSIMAIWPILYWSQTMRVDLLAVFFSMVGLLFAARSFDKVVYIWPALLAMMLAIWTKQTEIATPLASIPLLVAYHRKKTILPIGLFVLLNVVVLVAMEKATQGGFLRHILFYNINRFSADQIGTAAIIGAAYLPLFVLVAWGYSKRWRIIFGNQSQIVGKRLVNPLALQYMAVSGHFILSMALTITTLFKSGSDTNYMIEPLVAALIPLGWLFLDCWRNEVSKGRCLLSTSLIPAIWLVWIATIPVPPILSEPLPVYSKLLSMIAQADKPVVSDNMVLLMQAGKPIPWESAIFAELAARGVWDEEQIIEMLKEHKFEFLILSTGERDRFDSRYTPRVRAAIQEYYPQATILEEYLIRKP